MPPRPLSPAPLDPPARRGSRTPPKPPTEGLLPGPAELLARLVMLAAVVVTPWLFGGINPQVQSWLFVALLVGLLAGGVAWHRSEPRRAVPLAVLPLVLALAWGLFQLVPLDATTLGVLSPAGDRLWRELLSENPSPGIGTVAAETSLAAPGGPDGATRAEPADASLAAALGVNASREHPPLSLYPASTRRDLLLLTLATATFVVGATLFASRRGLRWLLVLVALNGAALAFFGIVQQLTWNGRLYWQFVLSQGGVPFASYVNKNHAAGYLSLCLACALGWMVWAGHGLVQRVARGAPVSPETQGWRPRLAAAGRRCWLVLASLDAPLLFSVTAVVCIVAGLACSLSRGAWLSAVGAAALVALAGDLLQAGRVRWWALASAVVVPCALAAVLVAWLGGGDSVARQAGRLVDEGQSLSNPRLAHWRDGAAAAGDFWRCGSGLGTYRYIYRLYEQRPSDVWYFHAENQYLEALVETGLPGLTLLLSAMALGALACARLLLQPPGSLAYCAGVMGAFALGSQVFHASVDFALYLPANLLLFALLMGAAAGWAVHTQAAAVGDGLFHHAPVWQRLAGSVIPPRWAGLLIGGLACGLAVAGVTSQGWVAVADALRHAPPPASAQAATPPELAERLQRVDAALSLVPDDAELHLRAAQLWAFRYRLVTLNQRVAERGAAVAGDALWQATEPGAVRARIYSLEANQRTVERDDLRRAPAVRDNLSNATRHLLHARRACPLLPQVHLHLAETQVLAVETGQDDVHLARARRLAPGDDELWTYAGKLELDAGRIEAACASWQHAVELAPQRLPAILAWARPRMALAAYVAQLLPNSPELVLSAAQCLAADPLDKPALNATLAKLQSLVDQAPYSEAERDYYQAALWASRGEPLRALPELARAVELCPDRTSWRYQLALLLRQAGRIPEAREQMKLCMRAEPTNSRYEQLLRELIRAEITQGKDRTKGA